MELEKLKPIWEKESENRFVNQRIEKEEIRSLMEQKSQTTLAKIKRKMKFKVTTAGTIGFGTLVIGGLYLLGFLDEPLFIAQLLTAGETGVILMLMGMVLAVVAVANLVSYKRINQFEQTSKPLKQTLGEVVDILQNIMSLGIYSDVIFVPLFTGFAAYVWLFQRNGFVLDIRLFYLVLIVCATAILSHSIASRLMQRKHGGNLERLQGYLRELESSS